MPEFNVASYIRQMEESAGLNPDTTAAYDGGMTAVPREELNAKLETVEARFEARTAAIVTSLDNMRSELQATRAGVAGLKTTMVVTAIGSVIAIVGGIAAFNATVLSNMVASFESGRTSGSSYSTLSEQLKTTQDQVKGIESRLPSKK